MTSFPAAPAAINEEAVRRELWLSFCSLVRSYVAAAQIGSDVPLALVAQPNQDELQLVSATRTIKLLAEPTQSTSYWSIHPAAATAQDTLVAEGAFRIGLDSRIEWSGIEGRQEMDAIAETLATLVLE